MAAKKSLRHAALSGTESPLMDHTLAIECDLEFRNCSTFVPASPDLVCLFLQSKFFVLIFHTLFFFTIRE